MNSRLCNAIASLCFCLSGFSQSEPTQSDYLFPVRPGEQNFLAGSMGELRTSHFHGGIDIKTGGRIGLPVYATSDGYISRIQVSTGGYGHVLYLKHDDGNISVYGHLNLFEDGLEKYLRYQQYENETYEIRLFPQKDLFRFNKGDIIAYSGNTGSSSGPHLHFEIRDANHRFMNPMDFGFTEIKDDIAPIMKSIAFKTLDADSRVNGAFGRFEFDVIKVQDKYHIRKPVELKGNIGAEIYCYDNQNGTYSRNGVPEVVFTINDDTVFHELKESMSFAKNRNILVHYDYETYLKKRRKYNKLFLEDGNELDIYLNTKRSLSFDDTNHDLQIFARDDSHNWSILESKVNNRKIVYPETPFITNFDIQDNHIQFVSYDTSATLHIGYIKKKVKPYIDRKGRYFYLWDLRNGLPDSIISGTKKIFPEFYVTIPSGDQFSFYNGDFDLVSEANSLFDTLYLRFEKEIDSARSLEIFKFKNVMNPLNRPISLTLKPRWEYGEKSAVFSVSGSRLRYVGGDLQPDNTYTFETRDFGDYTISYDTIPPTITPINWSSSNLKLKISDDLSGIKEYRATVDGEFLLMRYEAKRDLLMALPKDEKNPISGEFLLVVEDYLGNKTEIKRIL